MIRGNCGYGNGDLLLAQDAPVQETPASDPYDPNDAAAVAAYWAGATVKRGRGRPAVAMKCPTSNMPIDAEVFDAVAHGRT